jgi:long-chain acyl-CoA synthetase
VSAPARRSPNDVALDDPERRRSWAELEDRTRRLAHFFRDDLGLAPGDHAAFLMANRVEALELTWAAMLAGIWMTPVNWHLAPNEIEYVLSDSGSRLLIHDDVYAGPAHIASQAAGVESLVCVGDELDRAIATASDAPIPDGAPAGGNMIYTSGTTGNPKGVKRFRPPTLGAALDAARAGGAATRLDGSGPHLITGPMYHAAPLMFAFYDLLNGAPVVIMDRWDDARCLELLMEREIRITHLVPTMFVRLLRLPEELRERFGAPRLEVVLHGAAPVSPEIKQRMIDWWGPVLVEYWGATEGGVNTLIDSKEWLEHPGSVGRALPAFELFTVDEQGERLPPGEVGELFCRRRDGAQTFEYHGDAEKTAKAYLEPGTFTIGDVGRVDAEGFVHLSDRRSNMIISGGVNIYPVEIEQVLQAHPAVADVGVFGIPDDEWGESVKAAIELRSGFVASQELEAEILVFARGRLAGYKIPRSIDFEAALPRHDSGKLYIRVLRDRYWVGRSRSI